MTSGGIYKGYSWRRQSIVRRLSIVTTHRALMYNVQGYLLDQLDKSNESKGHTARTIKLTFNLGWWIELAMRLLGSYVSGTSPDNNYGRDMDMKNVRFTFRSCLISIKAYRPVKPE